MRADNSESGVVTEGAGKDRLVRADNGEPGVDPGGTCKNRLVRAGHREPGVVTAGSGKNLLVRADNAEPGVVTGGNGDNGAATGGSAEREVVFAPGVDKSSVATHDVVVGRPAVGLADDRTFWPQEISAQQSAASPLSSAPLPRSWQPLEYLTPVSFA